MKTNQNRRNRTPNPRRGQREPQIDYAASVPGWENLGPLLPTGKRFVRRVKNTSTGEEAVLKYLNNQVKDNLERRKRAFDEAANMHKMTGTPGVLPVLAIDTENGAKPLWYVMPLAKPLREALAEATTFQELVSAFADLAETLTELAKQGIYHRDIKPDNLFWHDGRAVLGDFGIARWGKPGLTQVGEKVGPMAFIAPEMYTAGGDETGANADVYSLAQSFFVIGRRGADFPPGGTQWADVDDFSFPLWMGEDRLHGLRHTLEAATRYRPGDRLAMADFASQLRDWLSIKINEMLPIPPRPAQGGWASGQDLRLDVAWTRRVLKFALLLLAEEGLGPIWNEFPIGDRRDWLGTYGWQPNHPDGFRADHTEFRSYEASAQGVRMVLGAAIHGRNVSYIAEIHDRNEVGWKLRWQSRETPWQPARLPSAQLALQGLTRQLEDQFT